MASKCIGLVLASGNEASLADMRELLGMQDKVGEPTQGEGEGAGRREGEGERAEKAQGEDREEEAAEVAGEQQASRPSSGKASGVSVM